MELDAVQSDKNTCSYCPGSVWTLQQILPDKLPILTAEFFSAPSAAAPFDSAAYKRQ